MKAEFAERCAARPAGATRTLVLCAEESDEREVREGYAALQRVRDASSPCTAACPSCCTSRRSTSSPRPPGSSASPTQMRAEGWDRELVRRLPDLEHGYWYVQARSMHQLLTTVPFQPGQSILDVGSNTCWAANHFAERGLRAIALDIATAELQGLYTADYFIDDGHVFFERVLGSMDAIPLASSSVDYVYCCEVLHHNDARRPAPDLRRDLPRAAPGRAAADGQRDAQDAARPARRARRGRRAVRGLRARPLGAALPLGGDPGRLPHRGHRAPLPPVLRRRRAAPDARARPRLRARRAAGLRRCARSGSRGGPTWRGSTTSGAGSR